MVTGMERSGVRLQMLFPPSVIVTGSNVPDGAVLDNVELLSR